ncbi:MAG: type III polyketide synthase [Chthoniobacterales bacterium]
MYLRAIATATPTRSFTQKECLELVRSSPGTLDRLDRRSRLMLQAVLCGESGIERRQFALHDANKLFELDADGLNAEFRAAAPELGTRALASALSQTDLTPADLDVLLVTTCTGYLCPGVSSYMAEMLGMRSDAWLQDIVGLGCGAAVPALRTASSILACHTELKVACVSVEVCSAAFYLDSDPGVVVSACLFGDGAAATIWQGTKDGTSLRCHDFSSLHQPEHRDLIRFEQREGKLRNLLHPSVPALAAAAVGRLYREATARAPIELTLSHPGGRDVIEAIERELPGVNLADTREILRRHGNMSSPSVIFALERALQRSAPVRGSDWWLVSFGAGFSAHACRITAT